MIIVELNKNDPNDAKQWLDAIKNKLGIDYTGDNTHQDKEKFVGRYYIALERYDVEQSKKRNERKYEWE